MSLPAVMAFRMSSSIHHRLLSAEAQFRKACEQVFILSRQVEEATQRYQEADECGHKVLRYNIRLRLSVLEGVRNMFYEYAAKKAANIVELQRIVLEADNVISDDSGDEFSDMDDLMFGSGSSADEYAISDDDSLEESC